MKELDSLLHSQLRLAVMSILMNIGEADIDYLKDKTDAPEGNLRDCLKNEYVEALKEYLNL